MRTKEALNLYATIRTDMTDYYLAQYDSRSNSVGFDDSESEHPSVRGPIDSLVSQGLFAWTERHAYRATKLGQRVSDALRLRELQGAVTMWRDGRNTVVRDGKNVPAVWDEKMRKYIPA